MKAYGIVADYQGITDGIVFASTSWEKARQRYAELIREAVDGVYNLAVTDDWSDDDFEAEYDALMSEDTKITHYTIEQFELEVE